MDNNMSHQFSLVYDDVRLLGSAGNISGANVPTFAVRANNCKMWRFGATTEELFANDQTSHRWDRSTIYPHIHWEPSTTATYTGTWAMDYIWVNPTNGSVVVTTGNTTGDFNAAVTTGQQYVTDLTPITLTSPGISALLQFRLYLSAFSAGTSMWLWGWDYHAGFVRPGTINIATYP
jgi:hypothetical protein